MEDVYFERIAGVGEHKQEPRQPAGVALNLQPIDSTNENALPIDLEPGGEAHAPDSPPAGEERVDENGFPVSPLRGQEDLWFVQANSLYRPLAKGASLGRSSGMMLLVSGVMTALFAMLTMNVVGIVLGLILATLGTMERGAASELAVAKPRAPLKLALNQMMVFGLIAAYAFAQTKTLETATAQALDGLSAQAGNSASGLPPEAAVLTEWLQGFGGSVPWILFGIVVGISLLIQGGMAIYYLTRVKRMREFRRELPPWVSDIVTTLAAR
jgi:hypothetical protein